MRTTTIPSQTVTEDICSLEETPGHQVRFLVGNKDANGNFVANSAYTQQIVVPISSFSF